MNLREAVRVFIPLLVILSLAAGCQAPAAQENRQETSIDVKLSQKEPSSQAPQSAPPKPQEGFEQEPPGALEP